MDVDGRGYGVGVVKCALGKSHNRDDQTVGLNEGANPALPM